MFGMILRDLSAIGYMQTSPDLIELDKIPPHVVNSVHSAELGEELDNTLIKPIVTFLQAALASSDKGDPDINHGNAKAGPSKEPRPVHISPSSANLCLMGSSGFLQKRQRKGKSVGVQT
jgi:hypothetical protein